MADEQERVWKLMKDLDFCMLVTQSQNGMRSRPMSSIVKMDEGKIYFITDTKAAKDEEIEANPEILLTYSDGKSRFVSTNATAVLDGNRDLLKKLWNPGAEAFWPNGLYDPSIVAIVATPSEAHYWQGSNAVVRAVQFAVALATGSTPEMGDEAKVRL